jgi:gluconate 2-dehydrogenase gamma chain
MVEDAIPRRGFLKGAAGVAAALTGHSEIAQAKAPAQSTAPRTTASDVYLTLTAAEAAFLSAAYDTFIPADKLTPSGTACGLVVYMDRQLAGAWGSGARLYRSGPFLQGKPEHGYQLPLTPREFSRPASRPPMPGRAKPTARISIGSRRPNATPH